MVEHAKLADALRFLSVDAVQKANSGHPGMPMGMADIATVLWRKYLRHNPADPQWWARDRFVLSNGHGAMLHYALLYLTGYDVSLDDLKSFRQLGSKTPGHPERGHTPGVETTTGPLGQGLGNAVGMALAEQLLSSIYNKNNLDLFGGYTYVFAGDGCMMEGVSHEVCSLAGTLGLGRLMVFYDDNGISIDGETKGWFGDQTAERFRAYGWHVVDAVDGHDPDAIDLAIQAARDVTDRPSLLVCKTHIGQGSPNRVDTAKAHGAPLGEEELVLMREALGWPHAPFEVPAEVREAWSAKVTGAERQAAWGECWAAYQASHPELADALDCRMRGDLPEDWEGRCAAWLNDQVSSEKAQATRKSSYEFLNHLAPHLEQLVGGSADLTPSNLTSWSGAKAIQAHAMSGRYLHYGVREFGMAAIMNGLAAYGGWIPFGGTFLTFVDYMRNAVRLSAMMGLRVIYVLTHDGIGVGEDGPTHQPIEHLSMLRLTPRLHTWRPADAVETAVAWQVAIERRDGSSVLALSRQTVPCLPHLPEHADKIRQGAYVLAQYMAGEAQRPDQQAMALPTVVLLATGSEVGLVVEAAQTLSQAGEVVRVVSVPCADVFLAQPQATQDDVLPKTVPVRVAVEAGSTAYWRAWVGDHGAVVGLDDFGASAPAEALYQHFDLTVDAIIATVRGCLANVANKTAIHH